MFGLVEEPKRGVPGAVRTDRDQVLQVLKTRSQVSTAVLLQLVVGRSGVNININITYLCVNIYMSVSSNIISKKTKICQDVR